MTDETTYSISDLSQEFDITTRSIRFYEDQGLLSPQRRGQTRIYSRQDRVRLKLILRGKRLGFSLNECRELLELYDHTTSGSEMQLQLLLTRITERRAVLEQQLKDIELMQRELDSVEQRCREELQERHGQATKDSVA
ncbi:liu genes regulator [Marinobacterium nitratireducens]|uniref:Liu genes regulator n=1 Tax=Marinobacterium nitratireducens TaxID=518897 RepID=A0A918DT64_9GAMM|nr:MerR family DNA-binding transcriptional regulator [Marinobacterium nitratireducens]GGO81300.1 liu genes regulator [Marinobacterium nitratireducens]